jgi:hypothetical protein
MKKTTIAIISPDDCPFHRMEITNQSEDDPDYYSADYECNHPHKCNDSCVRRRDFVGCPLKRYPCLIYVVPGD